MQERSPQPNPDEFLDRFGNIFSEMFGGFAGRGTDLRDDLWLDLVEAAEGGPVPFLHPVSKKRLSVSIPPGSDSGQVLRLAGQGGPGKPAGNLYLTLRVRSHRELEREGATIIHNAVIDRALARDGGHIRVPTLHGPREIELPARTQTGDRMTLSGCGAVKLGCPASPFPGREDAPFRSADVSSHRGDQIIKFTVRSRFVPIVGLAIMFCVVSGVVYLLWP